MQQKTHVKNIKTKYANRIIYDYKQFSTGNIVRNSTIAIC